VVHRQESKVLPDEANSSELVTHQKLGHEARKLDLSRSPLFAKTEAWDERHTLLLGQPDVTIPVFQNNLSHVRGLISQDHFSNSTRNQIDGLSQLLKSGSASVNATSKH